jgi:hypothetical protein
VQQSPLVSYIMIKCHDAARALDMMCTFEKNVLHILTFDTRWVETCLENTLPSAFKVSTRSQSRVHLSADASLYLEACIM